MTPTTEERAATMTGEDRAAEIRDHTEKSTTTTEAQGHAVTMTTEVRAAEIRDPTEKSTTTTESEVWAATMTRTADSDEEEELSVSGKQ